MAPDTITIAVTVANGPLAILNFVTCEYDAEGNSVWTREATPDLVNVEIDRAGLDAVQWRVIDPATVPIDRAFRGAWIDQGGSVGHDMEIARAIHLDRIRAARNAALVKLDLDYMRADETDDAETKAAIVIQKQALRDLPETFDLTGAGTIEELKELWPPELTA